MKQLQVELPRGTVHILASNLLLIHANNKQQDTINSWWRGQEKVDFSIQKQMRNICEAPVLIRMVTSHISMV